MTREEKNELLTQLGSEDYEAYMELRRQMDVLAADERMDDAQKAAFYAEIRDELVLLRKRRRSEWPKSCKLSTTDRRD